MELDKVCISTQSYIVCLCVHWSNNYTTINLMAENGAFYTLL